MTQIKSDTGDAIDVELHFDGERESAVLIIDGTRYHFERISRSELSSSYKVDQDPDYQPHTDAKGYCYMLAPFSE